MAEIEKAYWTHEVSKQLDIGDSTLRKYCIELEKNGYEFIKGAKDSRAFTDHDVIALNYFKTLIRDKNHTLKQAAISVASKFKRNEVNEGTIPVTMDETRSLNALQGIEKMILELTEEVREQKEMNKTLLKRTEKQEQFNKALVEKLEKQEQYIKESIEKRDRLLLESIRTSQEQSATKQKKKIIHRLKNLFSKH